MKVYKIKEIINIVLFIKDVKMTELAGKCSFSYTALRNFLIYHTKMSFEHIEEIFKALDFPLSMALVISEKEYSRKELIEQIIKLM